MRYFFEIAYNGTHYAGWQRQPNAVGVQQVVEDALSKLLRSTIEIVGSGRTDTGVHCEQQFFHADVQEEVDAGLLKAKLNAFLPKDISIASIKKVNADAHARYSALERSYQYRITLNKNPFLDGLALHYFKPIDAGTLNKASALLTGLHDFESFSKVHTDVKNFNCDVKTAHWQQHGNLLTFYITANRFLRGMVRALVGTQLDVGSGKITVEEFRKIIEQKDRKKAGMNAEPHGLYLTSVKYPDSIFDSQ
jgi:tRNA pseudouridine38-40 synthase